jgi:far upstream element-binding protein
MRKRILIRFFNFNFLFCLVIGRGGEQIKRMQMESQCKIRIASDSDGTSERSCTLTGSQEAIE